MTRRGSVGIYFSFILLHSVFLVFSRFQQEPEGNIERLKEEFRVSANATVAPGGTTGWHSHPGPVFVIVKKGPLTVYNAPECQPQVYQTGEGFIEKKPSQVHAVRNEGTETAEFIATFIIPVGATRRIDEPQPASLDCPLL